MVRTRIFAKSAALVIGTAIAAQAGPDLRPDETPTPTPVTNEFAIALYHELAADAGPGNLFFSPYSISEALTMTAEGARGRTADEMGRALRLPPHLRREGERPWEWGPVHERRAALRAALHGPREGETENRERIDRLRVELAELNRRLDEASRERDWIEVEAISPSARETAYRLNELLALVDRTELRSANALWVDRGLPLRAPFVEIADRFYGTGAAAVVDFWEGSAGARLRINEWIENRTDGRVRNLVPDGLLDRDTRLVLTNAIAFRGEWSEPFPENATKTSDFHLADGRVARLPLMKATFEKSARYGAFHADGSAFATPHRLFERADQAGPVARYPREDGFALVELPYQGERLSMVVIAPNRPDGLADLEAALTAEALSGWIARTEARSVEVRLPKFDLRTRSGLVEPLRNLGMRSAFEEDADFSGIAVPIGKRSLYLSEVLHQASVEVGEKGTEAAAATVVSVTLGITQSMAPPFTPTFRADRPFLFLIRDRASGTILFLGRMAGPVDA